MKNENKLDLRRYIMKEENPKSIGLFLTEVILISAGFVSAVKCNSTSLLQGTLETLLTAAALSITVFFSIVPLTNELLSRENERLKENEKKYNQGQGNKEVNKDFVESEKKMQIIKKRIRKIFGYKETFNQSLDYLKYLLFIAFFAILYSVGIGLGSIFANNRRSVSFLGMLNFITVAVLVVLMLFLIFNGRLFVRMTYSVDIMKALSDEILPSKKNQNEKTDL